MTKTGLKKGTYSMIAYLEPVEPNRAKTEGGGAQSKGLGFLDCFYVERASAAGALWAPGAQTTRSYQDLVIKA